MWIFTKKASFVTLLVQIKGGGPFGGFPSSRAFQLSRLKRKLLGILLGTDWYYHTTQQAFCFWGWRWLAAWYSAAGLWAGLAGLLLCLVGPGGGASSSQLSGGLQLSGACPVERRGFLPVERANLEARHATSKLGLAVLTMAWPGQAQCNSHHCR